MYPRGAHTHTQTLTHLDTGPKNHQNHCCNHKQSEHHKHHYLSSVNDARTRTARLAGRITTTWKSGQRIRLRLGVVLLIIGHLSVLFNRCTNSGEGSRLVPLCVPHMFLDLENSRVFATCRHSGSVQLVSPMTLEKHPQFQPCRAHQAVVHRDTLAGQVD